MKDRRLKYNLYDVLHTSNAEMFALSMVFFPNAHALSLHQLLRFLTQFHDHNPLNFVHFPSIILSHIASRQWPSIVAGCSSNGC